MRHRKSGRKLNRSSSHRKAMLRNMVTSLFEHERIQTTDARAKEVRRLAERLITAAKHGAASEAEASDAVDENDRRRLIAKGVHARRRVARTVRDRDVESRRRIRWSGLLWPLAPVDFFFCSCPA